MLTSESAMLQAVQEGYSPLKAYRRNELFLFLHSPKAMLEVDIDGGVDVTVAREATRSALKNFTLEILVNVTTARAGLGSVRLVLKNDAAVRVRPGGGQ